MHSETNFHLGEAGLEPVWKTILLLNRNIGLVSNGEQAKFYI